MSLSPETFQSCFSSWSLFLLGNKVEGVIAIYEKTIRGAKDKSKKNAITPHILSQSVLII